MTTEILSNTIVTDQPGNPDAGLQATAAEPQRPRTMLDLINNSPGKPWYDAAGPLTQWTLDRLVNRDDVYRQYKSLDRRYSNQLLTYTAPWFEDAREFGSLTGEVIEEHYRGDQERLIGLHAISVENTSRWFAIDVDQHGEDGPVLADENIDAAFSWYGELQAARLSSAAARCQRGWRLPSVGLPFRCSSVAGGAWLRIGLRAELRGVRAKKGPRRVPRRARGKPASALWLLVAATGAAPHQLALDEGVGRR